MEVEFGLKLIAERERKIRPIWAVMLERIKINPFCAECAIAAATMRAKLKILGSPIGPYDVLIAGTALAHNLIMVTSNLKEFNRLPELEIEDWRIS